MCVCGMAFASTKRRRRQTGDVYVSCSLLGELSRRVTLLRACVRHISQIREHFSVFLCVGVRHAAMCYLISYTKFHWIHSSFPRSLFYRETPSFRILFVFASLFAVVYVVFVFFMPNEFFEWCADANVLDRLARSTCVSSISNATHKTYKNERRNSYPRSVSVSVKSVLFFLWCSFAWRKLRSADAAAIFTVNLNGCWKPNLCGNR